MTEEEKRVFISGLFKDNNGEKITDISSFLDRIQRYRGYKEISESDYEYRFLEDFPTGIDLTSDEIQEIINNIYNLNGNFYDVDGIKSKITDFIFKHITDEAKIKYFHSLEFDKFYTNSGWSTDTARQYHLDTISHTLENIDALYEGDTRKEQAILRQRLGQLSPYLTLKSAMIHYINSLDYEEGNVQYFQEELELFLSLSDIEVDLSSFSEMRDKQAFLESELFSSIVNEYYEKLSPQERKRFVSDLSYDDSWNGSRRLGYKDEPMQNNLHIFRVLQDSEKIDSAGINLLAAALEYNAVESEFIVSILLKMNEINSTDDYVGIYLTLIERGERPKLQLNPEQIIELLSQRAQIRNEELLLGIFNALSPECVKEYLYTNPEDISFCMDVLTLEDAQEVLQNFDSQMDRVRLLMSMQSEAKDIAKLFPQIDDDYVKAQIIIAKTKNERYVGDADTIERIEKFFEVKEQLMAMSLYERVDFICSLHIENPEETTLTYQDINEMKKSFLAFVDKPEDRRRVIESMERYVEPDIQEYVDVVETMLREYIEDNLELTDEQMERFEIELRRNSVYFTNYDNGSTNGQARYIEKDVTIANHHRGDHKNIILDMIHEYSHVFSNASFITSAYHVGHTFEEGVADTFAEQVANHYLEKHGEIVINGEAIEAEYPLVSESSYESENGWTKTMMYILENGTNFEGTQAVAPDKMAIQEFIFGKKGAFFEICMGKEFIKDYDVDYLGQPIDVSVSETELARRYVDLSCVENENSLYHIKNNRLEEIAFKADLERRLFDIKPIEETGITQGQVAAAAYSLGRDMEYERQRNSERGR